MIPTILTNGEAERAGYFSVLEARPDLLPWFIAHVERHARREQWYPPQDIDVAIRAKWILLDKGLAATPYLVQMCEQNKGQFKAYRLPTAEEQLSALALAYIQLCQEANQPKVA